MVKQSIALLFLVAFIAQSFSKAFIVCTFYANRGYIAKNLCENRNKPKSCCQGKCQLRKKLNKENSEEKQGSEKKTGKESEVLDIMRFFEELPSPTFKQIAILFGTFKAADATDRSFSIFHPPCA